jgi:hypothetical protein
MLTSAPIYLLVVLLLAYSDSPENLLQWSGYGAGEMDFLWPVHVALWLSVVVVLVFANFMNKKLVSDSPVLLMRKTMIICSICDFPAVGALAMALLDGKIVIFGLMVIICTLAKLWFKPEID